MKKSFIASFKFFVFKDIRVVALYFYLFIQILNFSTNLIIKKKTIMKNIKSPLMLFFFLLLMVF
jgi:hypothetical protein